MENRKRGAKKLLLLENQKEVLQSNLALTEGGNHIPITNYKEEQENDDTERTYCGTCEEYVEESELQEVWVACDLCDLCDHWYYIHVKV